MEDKLGRLLMATDLSARSDRALARAIALAHDTNAPLSVLHVVDEDTPGLIARQLKDDVSHSLREQVSSFPAATEVSVHVKVTLGEDFKTIVEESEILDAGLIILGMHRRDAAVAKLFRGTTAERVIRLGVRPVLMVKDLMRGAYKRVLIGVDFSACSRRALEFALHFVPQGEFNLLHAYEVPFRGFLYGDETRSAVKKKHETELQQLVAEEFATLVPTTAPQPTNMNRIMKIGDTLSVIREQVNIIRPDLLVVGTHGRTGIAHAVLGSVAEELLRDPPCDILVVKAW